jgi:hypothetical protein
MVPSRAGLRYSGNKLLDFPDAFDFKDSRTAGLSMEAAFRLPGSPWSMVARLHHRSGIFGLFSHSGSNLVELGLRYRF